LLNNATRAAAATAADLRARWPLVLCCRRRRALDLHRHVLGRQSLAAFVDHSVTLDENLGSDVSSIGDLAGASGCIDNAITVVVDLHASLLAIVVDSAGGVAIV